MGTSGWGSNTQILTKKNPNIDIMLKYSQFGPLENKKYPQNTFRLNLDVVVEYYGSVTIRCRLSDDVVSHVGQLLSSINLSNE